MPLHSLSAGQLAVSSSALLAVKAARYPNTELTWDRSRNMITNHEEANATIVRRTYRDGFAPPVIAMGDDKS